ncbi:MAG: YncE family protein, partial [Candidatus Cloacimonetes bacterium]|nr:YncE family protein [Candidatus Cloacimonadota bacterium]
MERKKRSLLLCLLLFSIALFGGNAYVVNSASQTLSKINLESGVVDNKFVTLGQYEGSAPNKIAIVDNFALVVVTYENCVQKINLTTGETVCYISLGDSSFPNDIIVEGAFAFVTGNKSCKLYKINISDNTVVGSVDVGLAPQGLKVVNGNVWVLNTGFVSSGVYETGTVSVVDPADMTVLQTIETSLNPANMVQVNENVYVVCTGDYGSELGKISVIKTPENTVTETIEIGGTPASIVCVNNKFYLGNSWPAGVYVYDFINATIESTPEDKVFKGGNFLEMGDEYLAVIDGGDYVQNSSVYLYDLTDNSLVAEYELGVGAVHIKFDSDFSDADEDIIVNTFKLQNYPNPFNPTT